MNIPISPNSRPQKDHAMFASLAIRDYRFLWIGMLCSAFAMNMQLVARGWLVYEMTASALDLTYVTMSFMLPQIFFSPIGGVLADRIRKKNIVGWAPIANGLASLVMAYVVMTEQVRFEHFMLAGFFNGAALALSIPARTALIPEIVGERLMFNAMAFNTASWNLSRILGPALAGFMIALFAQGDSNSTLAVGLVYLLLSVLYFISGSTVIYIKHSGAPVQASNKSPLRDLIEGIGYVIQSKQVGGLILLSIYPFLFGLSINTFLPAYSRDVLSGGADDLGILMTSMGTGAIVGSLILTKLGNMRHKGYWVITTSMLWGLGVVLFSFSAHLSVAVVCIGFVGLASAINMSMSRSLIQLQAPQNMRGRIMSIDMMSHGLMPIGAIPIGYIAESISIQAALISSGSILILLTFVSAFFMPSIRAIDTGYTQKTRDS